ncbi:calcium-binding protein [uncultured Tateyamaria sp.]|uniref:calcium-binding protein n=1 Tax=uncultured Tateyamaria sp. TaxID=455651 RepID=UPI0026118E81|nr:calcium-binding protein [uncultured Tateyamaria sp.]
MLFLLSLFPAMFAGSFSTEEDVFAEDEKFAENDADQVLVGTRGPDDITGGEGNDDIIGLLGDDTLDGGLGGNDVIQGFNGNDLIIGGEGNDGLQGRGDNDTVQGFSGDDWVDGNDGEDVVRGGGGDDVAIGGKGADVVDGRSGDDVVVGGELIADPLTNAQLRALLDGADVDDLFPDETSPLAEMRDDGAADTLAGGNGNDLLILGAGDEATGGRELDAFAVIADQDDSDLGPAVINDFNSPAGEGIALYFRADETVEPSDISVSDDGDDALVSYDGEVLARVTGAAGTLTAEDIGILQFDDTAEPPVIDGTESDDTIFGTGADEIINGLGEEDEISGGAGSDTISGGDGSDIIQGQSGFDVITGNADNDFLQGRGGEDTLSGNQGFDWVDGNDGDDKVNGGLQADTVIGGLGVDLLSGGEGNDIVVAGELLRDPLTNGEFAALRGGASLEDVAPDAVSDGVVTAVDDQFLMDTLDGGNGDDLLIFGQGDIATGGAGADVFAAFGAADPVAESIVTDFNPAEDGLVLIDPSITNGPAPTVTVTTDGDDAIVRMNGEAIMRVTGAAGTVVASEIQVISGVRADLF